MPFLFYVANFGRGFIRRNQFDFEVAEKENMIRRSGISLIDTSLVALLLGIWISITVFFISGLGPESRSSILERDLHKLRSWIERCTRPDDGQPSTDRGETFESLLRSKADRTDPEGDSDSASERYPRRLSLNRFTSHRTVRVDHIPAGTRTATKRLGTRT